MSDPYWTSDERATMEAVNEANSVIGMEEWQKAIDAGAVEKRWRTQRDEIVRESHRAVDGHKEAINSFFVLKRGIVRFPGDEYYCKAESVRCRCGLEFLDKDGNVVGIYWTKRGEKVNKIDEKVQFTMYQNNDNIVSNKISDDVIAPRNTEPLTDEQKEAVLEEIKKYGFESDIHFTNHSETSFHGSREANDGPFSFLVISPDVYPWPYQNRTANQRISMRGCIAHELAGHWRAYLRGTTKTIRDLEEAQASIRASKFGIGLSDKERKDLFEDGLNRLKKLNMTFDEAKDILDIWEF